MADFPNMWQRFWQRFEPNDSERSVSVWQRFDLDDGEVNVDILYRLAQRDLRLVSELRSNVAPLIIALNQTNGRANENMNALISILNAAVENCEETITFISNEVRFESPKLEGKYSNRGESAPDAYVAPAENAERDASSTDRDRGGHWDQSANDEEISSTDDSKLEFSHENELLSRILSAVELAHEEIKVGFEVNALWEKKFDALHRNLEQQLGDAIARNTEPILQTVMRIHERIGEFADRYSELDGIESDERVLSLINGIRDEIEIMLEDHGIVPFTMRGIEEKFDPVCQVAIRTIPAPSEERIGLVADWVVKGFQKGEKIAKKEKVHVYARA